MSQLHVRADPGDVAPFVLLPGDPDRASHIAREFFESPRRYTEYRHLYGYTGSFSGMPVSVQTTGMGCPSLAIVVEELIRLGADTLVRVGTCGAAGEAVTPGDIVVATSSVPADGTSASYLHGEPHAPTATFEVTRALVEAAERSGHRAHVGLVRTEDAFYGTDAADVPTLRDRGVLAVEMEAAALFTLGALRGVRTGCVLVASNNIGDATFVDPDVLTRGIDAMIGIVLDAARALHRAGSREGTT